jgi:hypothetical protein
VAQVPSRLHSLLIRHNRLHRSDSIDISEYYKPNPSKKSATRWYKSIKVKVTVPDKIEHPNHNNISLTESKEGKDELRRTKRRRVK